MVASISNALDLLPGSNVTLKSGVVKAACDGYRCECIAYANASAAVALAPEDAVIPSAVLQGPQIFPVCDEGGLRITSDQSTGGGGREMTYVWNATLSSEATGANMTAIAAARDALDAAAARAVETFSLTSDELATVSAFAKIELTLKLENFLDRASESDAFVVRLSSEALPSVELVGGAHREIAVNRALSVEAAAAASTCDGDAGAGVSYAWRLYSADGTELDVASTSKNPRFFKLDANALEAGEVYDLRVIVSDKTNLNNTATTTIFVTSGAVVATIDGGNRVVSMYDTLVLDANASYDENGASDLAYAWSCDREDVIIPSSPVVALDVSGLGEGRVVFAVNVSRVDGDDGASSSASVIIDLVASRPPRTSVDAVVGRVNAALKLTLRGAAAVDAATTLRGNWSLRAGELYDNVDLAAVARTSLVGSTFGTSLASDLVLAPYALVAGAT